MDETSVSRSALKLKAPVPKYGNEEFSFLKSEILKWTRPGLDTLVHYVTSRCNGKCSHCYFSDELNQKNDIAPEQHIQMIEKIGPLKAVLIAGGEPFLATNLSEILIAYVEKCGVKFAQIPTMAFHGARMEEVINKVLSTCPDLNLTINVSIDGFEDFHNENRKVKNVFNIAIENIKKANDLKNKYPRLRVCVVSVMMPKNFDQLKDFANFIKKEVDPDAHILEPMRAQEFNMNRADSLAAFDELRIFWKDIIRYYYNKEQTGSKNLYASKFMRKQILNFALQNFDISFANFMSHKPWPMACVAGKRIAVLYPEGDVAVCELRERITNIRNHDFDLKKAMASAEFKKDVAKVATDKCFCTHGCFIPPSTRYSVTGLARVLLENKK